MPFTLPLGYGWLKDIETDKLSIEVLILITFVTEDTLGTSKNRVFALGTEI